jgi:hypothetical protein
MRYSLILTGLLLTGGAMAQCLLTDFEGYALGSNG